MDAAGDEDEAAKRARTLNMQTANQGWPFLVFLDRFEIKNAKVVRVRHPSLYSHRRFEATKKDGDHKGCVPR